MKIMRIRTFAIFASLLFSFETNAAESWSPALTEHGQPDMQGIWFYGSSTPFERPPELGNKQSYSEEEALEVLGALLEADRQKMQPLDSKRSAPEAGAAIAQQADHNFSISRTNLIRINNQYRTSQIVSPANGRLPLKQGGRDYFESLIDQGRGAYDGPEIRPASERCVGPNGGPMAPVIGWFYNANMQIVQTEDYVMLLSEMNHDARIIPLVDEATTVNYSQWMGHSVGQWEGKVLVVETRGFRPEQSWFAFRLTDKLEMTERFELSSENELFYSYTFNDPELFTEPVTVEKNIVRRETNEQIFEYACHEGNYSFSSILAGARRLEIEAMD